MNTIQMQKDNNSHNILETMSHEFNDHDFYGLEFIMDEFCEDEEINKSSGKTLDDIDWFGLINP